MDIEPYLTPGSIITLGEPHDFKYKIESKEGERLGLRCKRIGSDKEWSQGIDYVDISNLQQKYKITIQPKYNHHWE